jgi:hypothetical protein
MADQILKKAGDKALKSDKRQFCDKMAEIKKIFLEEIETSEIALARERFLEVLLQTPQAKKSYLEAIQGLPEETAGWGVQWLQAVVDEAVRRAAGILSEFQLVKKLSTSPSKYRR